MIVVAGLGLIGFPHQPVFALEAADRHITVDEHRIRYRVHGGKEPAILFIHGNNLSINTWDGVVENLSGHKMVLLDLLGFAGSDRPKLAYDLECHRRYILKFIELLELQRPIIVGHSMGGTIAAWTAAKSPDAIAGAVLISLPGVPGSLIYAWPKNLICRPGLLNRVSFYVTDSALFQAIFPLSLARQTLGITSSYTQHFTEALSEIEKPTLLLMSPTDQRTPIGVSKVYQDRVKRLVYNVMPAIAGHMAPETYPAGTAREIAEFIANSL